jgi:hypothetical protein
MHDLEKSDSAVVAAKSPNKAGSPAAEAVEPRAGTKGNADQQSTHRTQTRERVTQALNRVRQAARQRKKERFTALLHHVNVDALGTAFYALKRKAAAGVDGVTWQDYEADLGRNLEDLHGRVHRGAYRPTKNPIDRNHGIYRILGQNRPSRRFQTTNQTASVMIELPAGRADVLPTNGGVGVRGGRASKLHRNFTAAPASLVRE